MTVQQYNNWSNAAGFGMFGFCMLYSMSEKWKRTSV